MTRGSRGESIPSIRLAAVFLAVASAAGAQQPVVTEMEVVPHVVAVTSNPRTPTSFVLEALLWTGLPGDRASIVKSQGVTPSWVISGNSGVQLTSSQDGFHATVTINAGTTLSLPVIVQALAGGIGARSMLVPGDLASEDKIDASYSDRGQPLVAIVRGWRTPADGSCALWLASALVRTGTVGEVAAECQGNGPPWGLALLDGRHAMEMYRPAWSSGLDRVNASLPGLTRTIPWALRIVMGGGTGVADRQTEAENFTLDEAAHANDALTVSRAGILLGVPHKQVFTSQAQAKAVTCAEGDVLTSMYDYFPPKAPPSTEPMLHVYVIDAMGNKDGFTCAPTKDRPFPVIYLRGAATSGALLVHELGHALGLGTPGAGHTDDIPGFDPANVMVSCYADSDNVWRERFTVGQVLRMNADERSWLNWGKDETGALLRAQAGPRLVCGCGYDDPPGPCLRLVDDVAHERGGLGRLHPWDCTDEIQLPGSALGGGESPLALIAGRRPGTPLSECRLDIPGTDTTRYNADFIRFDNVTRTSGCDSWIAIFFRHHAPIFRDLTLIPDEWSDASELRVLDRTPAPPVPLTVHVHFELKDAVAVEAGLARAAKIFGADNRAGLKFTFVRHPAPLPSCPADAPPVFQVCWSSGPGPTIPQLIGMKLGLAMLGGVSQPATGLAGNAMRPEAAAGAALTLGQIFRIHATLRTGDFPSCATNTVPLCPPLEANTAP